MNRIAKRAVAVTAAFVAFGPLTSTGLTYATERHLVSTYTKISDAYPPLTFTDHTTGQTLDGPHAWAESRRLPFADEMDASADDIDTLIDLAVAADLGMTAENIDEEPPSAKGTMSMSIFADYSVEGCRVIEDVVTFESNRRRAAALCDRLTDEHLQDMRHTAWLHAFLHFRATCATEHSIIPEDIDPATVKDYRERTASNVLGYLVPADAVKAGDPDAVKAEPIAKRWLDSIASTATRANCRAWDPNLAKPLYVDESGWLAIDHRDDDSTGATTGTTTGTAGNAPASTGKNAA